MTAFKYDDIIKNITGFDYYFDIFWKILCSTTLNQSFTTRRNWFRIYEGGVGGGLLPPGYLMSKKPRLVSV